MPLKAFLTFVSRTSKNWAANLRPTSPLKVARNIAIPMRRTPSELSWPRASMSNACSFSGNFERNDITNRLLPVSQMGNNKRGGQVPPLLLLVTNPVSIITGTLYAVTNDLMTTWQPGRSRVQLASKPDNRQQCHIRRSSSLPMATNRYWNP